MKEKMKKYNIIIILALLISSILIICILNSNKAVSIVNIFNVEKCINESKELAGKEFGEKEYKQLIKDLEKFAKNDRIKRSDNEITVTYDVKELETLYKEQEFKFSDNKLVSYKERLGTFDFDNHYNADTIKEQYIKLKEQLIANYGQPEIREDEKENLTDKVYYWQNENIEIPLIEEKDDVPYEATWLSAYIKIYL